ncbi:hypothetical protein ACF0H5_017008 [Mactra antiquata]
MKITEVLNCSFSAWYSKFKEYTVKSHVIPLPPEFIEYLLADQIVLPEQTVAMATADPDSDDDNRSAEDDIDWTTEDSLTPVAEPPSFPEFEAILKSTIKKLGGQVFPKLNWSSPKDAVWISFDRTLMCTCLNDVYLLLKSSDFITHDLTQPFKHCSDDENLKKETTVQYDLILRKWLSMNPAYEFRCFVKHNKLIGITQRHIDMYYEFIPENKKEIVSDIQGFFYHIIKDNFPDKNYCFDVYRRHQGKLILLDFNPFGRVTDGLLFDWDELEGNGLLPENDSAHHIPEIRCIDSPSGVQPNPYSAYGYPKDLKDISSGEDPTKLMELLKLKVQEQNGELSSSDDDEEIDLMPSNT